MNESAIASRCSCSFSFEIISTSPGTSLLDTTADVIVFHTSVDVAAASNAPVSVQVSLYDSEISGHMCKLRFDYIREGYEEGEVFAFDESGVVPIEEAKEHGRLVRSCSKEETH
jgi:hypothetical protein